MSEADDTLSEERAAILDRLDTVAISVKETITPRTLAVDELSPAERLHVVSAQLPHISVDGWRAMPPGAAAARDGGAAHEYAIVATIGEGGMGRVHLARQRSLDRDVALKTLKPGATRASLDALLHEARLTGSLEHPGVIPVHALGVDDDGRPMLVMKRAFGVDLAVLLANPGHHVWETRAADRLVACLEIVMQVCQTLELAHSRGIVHRDVKPENVMVGTFGEVYLLDWGIAATQAEAADARSFVGTPAYMAPEMAVGGPVDARTDVYLVGATLHEILTGRTRHDGATVVEVVRRAAVSEPVAYDASVPDELARLCNRATARRPQDRHASIRELREGLAAFLRHRTARAIAEAARERLVALEALLAASTGAPSDLARAYRLVTEARFGLTQSLHEHPDEGAKAAMRRCLLAAIDLELRQGHADTAEALLVEMDPPDEGAQRRVAEAREQSEHRLREGKRLAKLDRDLDPGHRARSRTFFLAGLLVFPMVLAGILHAAAARLSALRGFVETAIVVLFFCIWTFAARRRVLTNAFNRRLAAVYGISMLALLVHRGLNVAGSVPIHHLLIEDLLLLAAATGTATASILPRLWPVPAILAAGIPFLELWSDHNELGFAIVLTLATGATIVLLAPRTRR